MAAACSTSGNYAVHSGNSWGAPNYTTNDRQHQSRQKQSGHRHSNSVAGSAHQKIGRPYTISGKTYIPARDDNYNRVGIASWYGPKFHGKKTANGEVFDQNAMTAAHPTLPLPSIVRVTNLRTGKKILVRLNDRGPFVDNRLIDLSKRAAFELGYGSSGVTKVRVEYVGPASLPGARQSVTRVSTESQKKPRLQNASFAKQKSNIWPEDPKKKYRIALSKPRTSESGWFVQAGAYSSEQKAKRIASKMNISGRPKVQTAWINNRYIYRVLVGPYANKSQAVEQQREVISAGFVKARVTEQN
jgi:rare lipoprotein A